MTTLRAATLATLAALALACTIGKPAATTARESAVALSATAVPAAAMPTLATDSAAPAAGDTSAAYALVQRLDQRAHALARTTGCARASDCRVAPMGVAPCGGPRTYIAYCAATTDTVELQRTLRDLERAWNAHAGMMGSCRMLLPPTATLVAGRCGQSATTAPDAPR